MTRWPRGVFSRNLVLTTTFCLMWRQASVGDTITEVLYADETYLLGPLFVVQETQHFLIVDGQQGTGYTAGKHNVSKGVIRYLIMGASAIPYSQGAAGTAIGVDRVYEYPRAGLLPFAVAGAGFALWQLKRFRDEGSKSDAARAAGLADLADSIRMDREKHVLYAAASWLGAVLAAALGIEKVPVLELGDSARITLYPDGSYRLRYTLDPAK